MADIKTRKNTPKTIKTLDKAAIATERFKDTTMYIKDKANDNVSEETNIITDGADKILYGVNHTTDEIVNKANILGRKSLKETKANVINCKNQVNKFKKDIKFKKKIKSIASKIKINKPVIPKANNMILKKTIHKKALLKKTKGNVIIKLKRVAKGLFKSVKAIVLGAKALIAALIALGWVAVIFILIICMIAILCKSSFGIFLSSEKTAENSITMSSVITDINDDLNNRINELKNKNSYDEYELISNMSKWEDLLAIYAVKISGGDTYKETMTLDANKIKVLKDLFWQMNSISSSVNKKDGKQVLTIVINSKTVADMVVLNNFNEFQKEQLKEMLSKKYASLWKDVIYGKSVGNSSMVKIAQQQLGNIGGQKFWTWYGFNSRVEWCAIFVSWVANEAGYLNTKIPKFSSCQNQGVVWFKTMSLWHDKKFVPKPGDIIFFDWENDGHSDHVGIVEKVSGGKVYTIEGNSNNKVQKQTYKLNSKVIYGYGTPQY